MPDDIPDKDIEMVNAHVEKLGEHFDTVHVFVTRHEPTTEGGTIGLGIGAGNWFSRYGQIKEWVIKQDEQTRLNVRKTQEE